MVAAAAGDPGSSLCPKPKLASLCQVDAGRQGQVLWQGKRTCPIFLCQIWCHEYDKDVFFGHMLIIWADYVDLFSHVLHYHSLPDLAFQLWPKSLGLQVLQGDS